MLGRSTIHKTNISGQLRKQVLYVSAFTIPGDQARHGMAVANIMKPGLIKAESSRHTWARSRNCLKAYSAPALDRRWPRCDSRNGAPESLGGRLLRSAV